MLRLYILRHAKSSWADVGMQDFDRGLNERGARDLSKIAEAMRERDYLPAFIYCSPALRTRLTLQGIMGAFDAPPAVEYPENLYSGGVTDYLECVKKHPSAEPLMLIGHNPACAELANYMAIEGEPALTRILRDKFPTGALSAFDCEIDRWKSIDKERGRLIDFIVPREIA
jgi:phosphohistidine phosphatase